MGGYDRKKYIHASLLFVTFAIKKHPNEIEIEKAKAWQEKFVEYVKNYDDKDLQLAYTPIDLPVHSLDTSIEYWGISWLIDDWIIDFHWLQIEWCIDWLSKWCISWVNDVLID